MSSLFFRICMITYWTREVYSEYDWLLGSTWLVVDELLVPAGTVIEYNQDEFMDRSTYCSLYSLFWAYSIFTGKEVPKDVRHETVLMSLDEWVIKPNGGALLHEAVDFIRNRMSEVDGRQYVTYRVMMGSPTFWRLKELWYPIVTGFLWWPEFVEDMMSECTISDILTVGGVWVSGHAICDLPENLRLDSYKGRNCNIYWFKDDNLYNTFIRNTNMHFTHGYVFTSLEEEKMSQEKRDQKDIQRAIEEWITNWAELDRPATRGEVILMMARTLRRLEENQGG